MKITNRKALFDYEIQETFEAGINLTGPEVKAIKLGHADLAGSFVKIMGSEAYLINSKIYPYKYAQELQEYDPKRTRKLLLHKKELISLKSRVEGSNLTLVPLSWYTKGQLVKLEIAVGKGRKTYQKRELIKKRDQQRELEEALF